MQNAVEIINVTKRFGEVIAVNNVSLEIKEGELVTLLGPSGCGKTTLLRIIAGFERADSGTIKIFGKVANNIPPEKREVGMVFQNYALFPNMNVERNIAFPMNIAKKPKEEIERKVKELLDLVKLPGFEKRKITELSGGQKQRIALARALAREPKVLLLDEPLAALDAKVRLELRVEIKKIQQKVGTTMVYVTHDQEEALSISDRIAVMNHGVIYQVGTPTEIYNNPSHPFVAHFVGIMNFLNGKVSEDGEGIILGGKFFAFKDEKIKNLKNKDVLVAIRPERAYLSNRVSNSLDIFIPGKITVVNFIGSIVRVELELPENQVFTIDMRPEEFSRVNISEDLYVVFSPSSTIIFEKE